MMRYPIPAAALLLATLVAASAIAGQAVFPDSTWVRLAPDEVEQEADFAAYADVYQASGLTTKWMTSPHDTIYGEPASPRTLFDILASLEAIRRTLIASPAFDGPDDNGPLIRRHLTAELDQLIAATERQAADDPGIAADWEHVRRIVGMDRFQRKTAKWSDPAIHGAARPVVSSDIVFFPGEPTQIVLETLQGDGGLAPPTPYVYFATVAQAVEVRAVVSRVRRLFSKAFVEQMGVTSERLRSLNRSWDNYLAKGFTQYPWELWANDKLTASTWNSPPSTQWVIAHPEVAVVLDLRDAATARAETAVTIHGAGMIKYLGEERSWFLGLSASASFTGSADFGLGYGPTVHVGSASTFRKIPHVSISLLWHEFEGSGGRAPTIGLNFDLWSLLSTEIGEEKFLNVVAGGR